MTVYVVTWSGMGTHRLRSVWSTPEAAAVEAARLGKSYGDRGLVFACEVDSSRTPEAAATETWGKRA